MAYNIYLTDREGRTEEFWRVCWTREEVREVTGLSEHHTRQAIFTGWPTKAKENWIIIKSRTNGLRHGRKALRQTESPKDQETDDQRAPEAIRGMG